MPQILICTGCLVVIAIIGHIVIGALAAKDTCAPVDERERRTLARAGHYSSYIFTAVCLLSAPTLASVETIKAIAGKVADGGYDGVNGMAVTIGSDSRVAYAPGGGADHTQDIRSATKSITAILVGELLDDGSLKSTDVRLSDILTAEFGGVPENDPKRLITIQDLLTMRGGLACDDWVPASVGQEDKMYQTSDWVAFYLSQPVAYDRGKHFSYCTGGVIALGRIIEKLSGKSVPDYAQERLFGPLGITSAVWDSTPKGHTDTGGHLKLTLDDFHKIGLLLQSDGMWGDKRVIEADWLRVMLAEHARVPERRERYGYLWWRIDFPVGEQTTPVFYAHGNSGNFTFWMPEYDLVATFTATNYGTRQQFIPMKILATEILPAVSAAGVPATGN